MSCGLHEISGLSYYEDILTNEFEKRLINFIESGSWDHSLKRLTQHYGAKKYSYTNTVKNIKDLSDASPTPDIFKELLKLLYEKNILDSKEELDQFIVNRYLPGEGISHHTDHTTFFDEPIISVSLGSDCVMEFKRVSEMNKIIPKLLKRKSVLVLRKQARWSFLHGIKSSKTDHYPEIAIEKQPRTIRYSITGRKLK